MRVRPASTSSPAKPSSHWPRVPRLERFTDSKKPKSGSGATAARVVGRRCTPGEKADFIAYLSGE
ncbi:MAG: DUF1924 domain-containing protein [Rhodocyclaceae bacterium]|nr:DUF1924 domain-containing protein [Rhodocyclaceae bacterium]